MSESNAKFIKRVRPQVSQYETTLIEALERLEAAEAECERLRGEVKTAEDQRDHYERRAMRAELERNQAEQRAAWTELRAGVGKND